MPVHARDPELAAEPERPFEVVHQGPEEIPLQLHAVADCAPRLLQMGGHVVDPVVILRLAVDNLRVGEGRAVLRDHEGRVPVVLPQAGQEVVESLGVDFPPHLGLPAIRVDRAPVMKDGVGVSGKGPLGEIVIHAKEINGDWKKGGESLSSQRAEPPSLLQKVRERPSDTSR